MTGPHLVPQHFLPLLLLFHLLSGGCGSAPNRDILPVIEALPETQPPPSHIRHFVLPTPNQALFEPGAEEEYFVGTVGRSWPSGTFGCVRSEGWQMHEGIDIRSVQRDHRGEAIDPIYATADGTVAYLNEKPALSNYGVYVVLRHQVQGWEIFSLYAHLSSIREDLRTGQPVQAGDAIGVMGRTANTRQAISRERAHLHFELVLMLNDHFVDWHQKTYPGQRNDHGPWNGRNFVGIDPAQVLLQQHRDPATFDLDAIIRHQIALCRVLVRVTEFPWLERYPQLIEANPATDQEAIAAYELHLNYNGLPFRVVPRTSSEIGGRAKFQLLAVNEAESSEYPCRRLVQRRGAWELAPAGELRLNLLTHR